MTRIALQSVNLHYSVEALKERSLKALLLRLGAARRRGTIAPARAPCSR
jgi:hypothetical protein